jgi:site-specific recombinase XerD
MLLSTLIEGFLLDCRARNLSPATIDRAYGPCLRDFCEWMGDPPTSQVEADALRRFMVELQESNRFARGHHPWMEEIEDSPLSPWTIHRYVRVIKTMFKWAHDEKLLPRNKMASVKYPKLPKGRADVFSPEEIKILLEVARGTSFRNYAIVFLLLDTGIRREELVKLTVDDVNVVSGVVSVEHGKGDKQRKVRMGNACRKVLWRYVIEHRNPRDEEVRTFFLDRRGKGMSYNAVGMMLTHLSQTTGIRVYAHKFRHTFATMFAKNLPNAMLLADALGHEDLKMAKWYVHLAGTESTDNNSPMDKFLSN